MGQVVTTNVKRSFLRDAYDASVTGSITLYAQLRRWETTAREGIAAGQVVAATSSGNSVTTRSVSFFPPNIGLNPVDLLDFLAELVDLHDLCQTALITSGVVTPTDVQIKTEMLDRLQAVTDYQYSFATIRVCA